MAKILVAGDFYLKNRVAKLVEAGDCETTLSQVRPLVEQSDDSILNFEGPIVVRDVKPIPKVGPNMKQSVKALDAVDFMGFRCLSLANNHIADYGDIGIADTLETCATRGIATFGVGMNRDEAGKTLYREVCGKTFAYIAVCEREFCIAGKNKAGANPIEPIENYHQIKLAKTNADFVIVICHGSNEHYQLPPPRFKQMYRFFVDAGADAVINHHQHCFSGYEIYEEKPIFYGLGNFCFDVPGYKYKYKKWTDGYMVQLFFDKGKISFELFPYCQCAETPVVNFAIDVSRFQSELERLNGIIADDRKLEQCYEDFVRDRRNTMLSYLEPYRNRYLKWLRAKKLMFSLLGKKQLLLFLHIVRCESHRDVLLKALDESHEN